MKGILVLSAVVIWIGSIAYAQLSDNSWRSVGIVWGLLSVGIILFGIALTL